MRGGPKPKRYRRPSRNSNSAKDTAAGQRQYLRIDIGPEENLLIELIRFRDDPPPPAIRDAVGAWFKYRQIKPAPCLACGTELPNYIPDAFIFTHPHVDEPKVAAIGGVCTGCAALSDAALIDRALNFNKDGVYIHGKPEPVNH